MNSRSLQVKDLEPNFNGNLSVWVQWQHLRPGWNTSLPELFILARHGPCVPSAGNQVKHMERPERKHSGKVFKKKREYVEKSWLWHLLESVLWFYSGGWGFQQVSLTMCVISPHRGAPSTPAVEMQQMQISFRDIDQICVPPIDRILSVFIRPLQKGWVHRGWNGAGHVSGVESLIWSRL